MMNRSTTQIRLLVAVLVSILSFSFAKAEASNRNLPDSKGWYLGYGASLQAGYQLTSNLNLSIYCGLTRLSGERMDGMPEHLHKNNFVWESGIRLGISFVKTKKETLMETLRLMPTANGFLTTRLFIHLETPDGTVSNYDIEAPVMKSGGKYQINLEYEEMRPYMYLTSTKIDDWTEGWEYRVEILNPEY